MTHDNAGVDVLELLRSVRRFAAHFAYDLPGQHFVERVGAAREVILSRCTCTQS